MLVAPIIAAIGFKMTQEGDAAGWWFIAFAVLITACAIYNAFTR